MVFFHLRNMVNVKPLINKKDAEKNTCLYLKHHLSLQEELNLHSVLTTSKFSDHMWMDIWMPFPDVFRALFMTILTPYSILSLLLLSTLLRILTLKL